MSIYLELTREFNVGRLRAIISSGPAVVLLRLAIASKDGDWIVREDQEALGHVLGVLESHGAHYRFGAPLDLRWLREAGVRTSSSNIAECASAPISSRDRRV